MSQVDLLLIAGGLFWHKLLLTLRFIDLHVSLVMNITYRFTFSVKRTNIIKTYTRYKMYMYIVDLFCDNTNRFLIAIWVSKAKPEIMWWEVHFEQSNLFVCLSKIWLFDINYSIMLEIDDDIFESCLSCVKIEWKFLQTM